MKVGDYVRTISGEIYKLVDNFALIYFQKEQEIGIPEHQIIKSNPNIIDLIKVGDYVNGYQITSIQEIEEPCYQKRLAFSIIDGGENNICAQVFNDKDIKSIVTKEQFEQMEYKIGGNE